MVLPVKGRPGRPRCSRETRDQWLTFKSHLFFVSCTCVPHALFETTNACMSFQCLTGVHAPGPAPKYYS